MSSPVRSFLVALAAVMVCVSVLAPVAHATLLVARSLSDLVSDADHIVVVTGITETSRWDRFGRIVSDMRLRVTDVVKGEFKPGAEVSVTRLGGSIGDLAMTVAGEAVIGSGDRAVVFLDVVDDHGTLRISDMSLGMFPIVLRHGVTTVLPSGVGLSLVAEDATGALAPTAPPLAAPTSLGDFLSVLRDLAGTR